MIAPNHAAHYDSTALYIAADQIGTPLYYMTAWQVFGMAHPLEQFMMQRMGCFSIDRESADRRAYKQAIRILQTERYPLVVFPEGDIYHVTDRVTPFRDGAAAIALSAARRSQRAISVIPCGIKFWYLDDPTAELGRVMTQLERRLFLRPNEDDSLADRIYRFAEALLALKEIEYLHGSRAGHLVDRIRHLAESILNEMESRYRLDAASKLIPERVKELRQTIISRLDGLKRTRPKSPTQEFIDLSRDMDDLFFVVQLYSYPGDYLRENASWERLAETLDKFEEDVLDRKIPTVRGRRHVEISLGEPIRVENGNSGRDGVSELTREMQAAVQQQIDLLTSKQFVGPAGSDAAPNAA